MHLTVGLSSVGFVKRKKVLKEGKKLAVRLFFLSLFGQNQENTTVNTVSPCLVGVTSMPVIPCFL